MEKRSNAIRRLKIISGQINGLIHLLENERDCKEIFTQIKAVKNAFSGFSSQVMTGMLQECFSENNGGVDPKKMDEIVKYFSKL